MTDKKENDALIDSMDKDQLEEYALAKFSVELDKRKKLAALQRIVKKLEAGEPDDEKSAPTENVSDYLRHPDNNRVYQTTPLLLARGDMIPCDSKGRNV